MKVSLYRKIIISPLILLTLGQCINEGKEDMAITGALLIPVEEVSSASTESSTATVSSSTSSSSSSTTTTVKVTSMALGEDHTCALTNSGKVKCWGEGTNGKTGYGTTSDTGDNELPSTLGYLDFGTTETVTKITAGKDHTCALFTNGKVKCWGKGQFGRLGYGNSNDIGDDETPATVGFVNLGSVTVTDVTAGGYHTCVVLNTGSVMCWGQATSGVLGYSNATIIGDNEDPSAAGTVNTGVTAAEITAGLDHTCVRTTSNDLKCWGNGANGRRGYGNSTDIGDNETPSTIGTINLGLGRTATNIQTGTAHTCAVLDTGYVKCWGLGTLGRLGYGNTTTLGVNETPDSYGTVNLGASRTVSQFASRGLSNCAILDNSTIKCWGQSANGELGYGNTNNIGDDETPDSVGVVDIGSVTPSKIYGGANHFCIISSNDEVMCWGNNGNGQLGYGNTLQIGNNENPSAAGFVSILTSSEISGYLFGGIQKNQIFLILITISLLSLILIFIFRFICPP